jgi:hypothetical protein
MQILAYVLSVLCLVVGGVRAARAIRGWLWRRRERRNYQEIAALYAKLTPEERQRTLMWGIRETEKRLLEAVSNGHLSAKQAQMLQKQAKVDALAFKIGWDAGEIPLPDAVKPWGEGLHQNVLTPEQRAQLLRDLEPPEGGT